MDFVPKKWFKCACDCSNKKKHIIASAIILALIVIGAGVYFYKMQKADIGLEGAKSKVVEFVNGNLLQPGAAAEVVSAVKENDLYKITIKVGEQEIPTYITRDGKKFFPQVMDIDVAVDNNQESAEIKEIPKSDKPIVDLYVMSFCPFGNKAEDTLKPAYDLLKNKVDFNFHYIVTTSGSEVQSLHGAKEVVQNEREACVLKNYGKDKWMGFVTYVNANCGSDGACWETGAKNLGISTAKISACVTAEGVELMKTNEQASAAAGAQGSPTMTINGATTQAVYQYGNSEAYKQIICSAFNTVPTECSKTLSAATSTAQGGSCGN